MFHEVCLTFIFSITNIAGISDVQFYININNFRYWVKILGTIKNELPGYPRSMPLPVFTHVWSRFWLGWLFLIPDWFQGNRKSDACVNKSCTLCYITLYYVCCIGPGILHAPTVLVVASVAGHYYHWPFSPFFLVLLRALLFTHFGGTQEADFGPGGLRAPTVVADGSKAGLCFHLLTSFSPPFAFHPLRGNSCCWNFVSPHILA